MTCEVLIRKLQGMHRASHDGAGEDRQIPMYGEKKNSKHWLGRKRAAFYKILDSVLRNCPLRDLKPNTEHSAFALLFSHRRTRWLLAILSLRIQARPAFCEQNQKRNFNCGKGQKSNSKVCLSHIKLTSAAAASQSVSVFRCGYLVS